MKKLAVAAIITSGLWAESIKAETGVGAFVGNPYWGAELKHNGLRMNVSLDEQFGLAMNKTFAVNNTPLYLFIGGQYVDRERHYIAVTPGIGAEFRVKPMGFYLDLAPSVYLDELEVELEARAGLRVYF
ncbi:hypothetical protein J4N42_03345 [Vibrio sp. SCSIO 43135]|uniref:Uncharacterized protein n=1 Tax=Vibrio paucivorans TaxID=2829489 RepID=A0A9X3HT22_9VIBR|nr:MULTISPECIES: hypothetical protein [Vibrio]MCW8335485.1 hypothetical protein [Vibrio paucivorans]USD41768.1 hypothetical protein J4N42_03345 [Vibrio sp. SCSIO 43135]